MDGPVIEHVVDCSTGEAVDRDFEGDLARLQPDPAIAERVARVDAALTRLKSLAVSDKVVADILTVLGLDK